MSRKISVLITGAAGFIGRHVAHEFSNQGWYVVGMGRGDWTDWQAYGISEWHCCEVSLVALMKYAGKPDVIVHCAGGASVGFSVEEPYQDFIKTVDTMAQVLEFIRSYSPISKLVYTSSAAVYGQVSELPISEDALLKPVSPYGLHKKIAESLCQHYAYQYSVPVAIVRLFSIYGSGLKKQLLWDACQKFKNGNAEFFGTGEEIRDWLYITDISRLIFIAAQKASIQCPVVNAGSGVGVCVKELLGYAASQYGLNKEIIFSSLPKFGDPNAYIADISTITEWGWRPKINWREGVSEYIAWYKKCQ